MQHSRDQSYGILSRYVTTCNNIAAAMRKKGAARIAFCSYNENFRLVIRDFFQEKKRGSVFHRKQQFFHKKKNQQYTIKIESSNKSKLFIKRRKEYKIIKIQFSLIWNFLILFSQQVASFLLSQRQRRIRKKVLYDQSDKKHAKII